MFLKKIFENVGDLKKNVDFKTEKLQIKMNAQMSMKLTIMPFINSQLFLMCCMGAF